MCVVLAKFDTFCMFSQATGVCSWRAEGIKHRKNEARLFAIEDTADILSSRNVRGMGS